jgi:hypothetical protein
MDIKAAAIIGGGAIVVGLLLYIPGHFLAKYLLRRSQPKSNARGHITRLGFVVYGAMVFTMFIGYAQEHLSPQTWFGHFMSSWGGQLAYSVLVVAVWAGIERLLKKRGYVTWVPAPVAQPGIQADAASPRRLI